MEASGYLGSYCELQVSGAGRALGVASSPTQGSSIAGSAKCLSGMRLDTSMDRGSPVSPGSVLLG